MKLNKRIWLNAGMALSFAVLTGAIETVEADEGIAATESTDENISTKIVTHTIQFGDTLQKVADAYNTTVDKLVEWNHIQNKNLIFVGQTLNVHQSVSNNSAEEEPETEDEETETQESESSSDSADKESTEEDAEESPSEPIEMNSTASSNESSSLTYTVKSGDTINKIAQAHGVSGDDIVGWNGLANKNLIFVGQSLIIQANKTSDGEEVVDTPSSAPSQPSESVSIGEKMTPQQFVNTIGPAAQRVADEFGLYASVMIAQAALESGFGDSSLSLAPNHNLFGIKGSYNGQSVAMNTSEFIDGQWIRVVQNFKRYPSHQASMEDNARLLRRGLSWNSGFYSGTWIENTDSYRDATQWLEGRYATDPTYASKLNRIIDIYNLTQYDGETSNDATQPDKPEEKPADKDEQKEDKPVDAPSDSSNDSSQSTTRYYTVKSGDTLGHIARAHNTTVSRLKSLNNLSSDLIRVNQRLIVGESSSEASESDTSTPKPEQETSQDTTTKRRHTVQSGDTLSALARRYNTTVSRLREWNKLSSDLIRVNQSLIVEQGSTASSGQTMSPSSSSNSSSQTQHYTVKRGDTLSRIAREYNTTVSQLKSLNGLRSDIIYINQRLVVSGSASSGSNTSQSTSTERYRVKSGDTLSHIARAHNTTVSQLRQWNNLRSDLIFVNQQLIVKR